MDKKLEQKLEKIEEKLNDIDKTLIKQAGQLEHHIYRTDLLEKHVSLIEQKVEPISVHVQKFNGVLKAIGLVATLATIAGTILKLFEIF